MKTIVRVVTHYDENDPEFLSDYVSVDVYVGDALCAQYGDAYHDKGQAKSQGFVDGVRAALGSENVDVVHEQIADAVV